MGVMDFSDKSYSVDALFLMTLPSLVWMPMKIKYQLVMKQKIQQLILCGTVQFYIITLSNTIYFLIHFSSVMVAFLTSSGYRE